MFNTIGTQWCLHRVNLTMRVVVVVSYTGKCYYYSVFVHVVFSTRWFQLRDTDQKIYGFA